MAEITYIKGDATIPQGEGNKIIAHICNDKGYWGAGFVLAISNKWKTPEQEYRRLSPSKRKLGYVQLIPVENDIVVANMIAQDGIGLKQFNLPPIHYTALDLCFENLAKFATSTNASIHMPRIGTGLSMGKWKIIEFLIQENLSCNNINITVYDL